MSETKRATLIPFGADRADDRKGKQTAKTVRISFVFPESNEGTCPVYNYKEELAVAKKKDKTKPVNNGKSTNGLDPFDEDDDDVRRIAQEMEAKYGMGPPAKKKRKGRRDDYADIGMGYDESDSFIDNTDGYDEMIPQNVTTLHGGFYINCGALEFKTDEAFSSEISSSSSSSSSDDDNEPTNKTSRKRVLETSESEGETETDKGKENDKGEKKYKTGMSNGLPVVKKRKLIVPDKIRHLKKTMAEEPRKRTVKDLLKEKREVGNVVGLPESMSLDKLDTGDTVMKENKKPMSMMNVADIIECVAKGGENTNRLDVEMKEVPRESVNKDAPVVTTNLLQDKTVHVPSSEGENSRDSCHEQKREATQLPENLPDNILEIINKLKHTAAKNMESNLKIFSPSVNTLLLSIERKSRCLGKHSKSRIYQHLGLFMKCRKETLVRRAKKLIVEDDLQRLLLLVIELKRKIDQAMPPLLENYDRESQKIVQKKFSREGVELEETKQLRMPKRKFIWTEEIKKVLKDIVTIRRRCYTLDGKTKEDIDIQMNLYLKSDIQVLWPDGWMSMAALLKIYTNFGDNQPPVPPNKHNMFTSTSKENNSAMDGITHSKDIQKLSANPIAFIMKDIQQLPATATKEVTNSVVAAEKPSNSHCTNSKESQNDLPPGTKEMQKLATNTMLSITPIVPKSSTESASVKLPGNEVSINKIETERLTLPIEISKASGISISPTSIPEKSANPAKDESAVIRAVKIDTLLKQDVPKTHEKTTKFINLPQNSYTQKHHDWSIKPTRPPTDHKIENIIKPSKPENAVTIAPENLSKPKFEGPAKPKPENLPKPKTETIQDPPPPPRKPDLLDDVIVLDDGVPEDEAPVERAEIKQSNHQVIDLTAHTELKRKPGPKSKTKFYDPALIKPVKSALALESAKSKLSGNCSIDNILQDNLLNQEHYYNNLKKARTDHKTVPPQLLGKGQTDGGDIQKVMEDLKVLQKMSTPSKNAEPVGGSPVSVISFNKNYTPKTSSSSSNTGTANLVQPKVEPKADYGLGFQEAFQRQFLNDLKNTIAATQSGPAPPKNYNSAHSSSAPSHHQDKYYMNANNNYSQQNAGKYKTNYAAQQQGTFNLMDDMLANFISEYAYPKTATHKPKPPQK